MRIEEDMGRISCNQSMSRDTLGFTCDTWGSWNSKGLRLKGSMTCLRVKLVDA